MNRLKAYAIFWASVTVFMSAVSAGFYLVKLLVGNETWLGFSLMIVWITICFGITLGILIIFHKRSQKVNLDEGGGGGVGSY